MLTLAGTLLLLSICVGLGLACWWRFTALAIFDLLTVLLGSLAAAAGGLALFAGYHAFALLTLRYRLDRNALRIYWADSSAVVPLGQIRWAGMPRDIAAAEDQSPAGERRPFVLPGMRDNATSPPTVLYSPAPGSEQVLVVTEAARYAISPADPERFLSELERRRLLGPTRQLAEREARGRVSGHPLWSERAPRVLLGMALLMNLLLFGYLALVYARLPENLVMHWNAAGEPDRVGPPAEILRLPAVALALLLVDVALGLIAHPRDRLAAQFLYAGAVAVEVVFAAAIITIVGRAAI